MKHWLNILAITTIAASFTPVFAANLYDQIKPASPLDVQMAPQNALAMPPKKATLTHNDVHNQYAIAFDRFMQSNVKSSYGDFKILIETIVPNDYAYMRLAERMADIGFFNLSDLAISKISDKDISYLVVDDLKIYYFPSKKLQKNDEVYLAEIFSNIVYNDQSREATSELVKNTELLTESDYANFIAALGYFKSNDLDIANKYADKAISMNPKNLNYRKLKAEIQAQGKKTLNALRTVDYIKSQRLYSADFSRKANSLEQYILYKTKKSDAEKMYHLGYYYYYENELGKSIRTLQGAISNKKKINKNVYALMSRVYFDMSEFEKSKDTALKAYKLDSNNSMALVVLGDLHFRTQDYKTALKYYKDAMANESNSSVPAVRVAQTYQKLSKDKKAMEIYEKVLRTYSDSYVAYYNVGLNDKSKEIAYLKKSIAINMAFKDGWLDLARVEVERHSFEQAKKYLAVANYIDENDFRYYYYQGLISKNQGLSQDAEANFKKSLLLNPDYKPAKEELSI